MNQRFLLLLLLYHAKKNTLEKQLNHDIRERLIIENCNNQKFAKRIKGINFACYLQCSQLNMIRAQIQRNILHMLQLFPFVWLSPNWSLELESEARELQIDICTSSLDTQLDRQRHDEWGRERG